MSIYLSEEERMIQKTARDFARKDIAAVVDDGIFHEEIYCKLAELGFMGMTMPEEYGGVGFSNLSLALTLEEISRV